MSALEEMLSLHLRAEKIEFVREATLIPGRKFRVDFFIKPGLCVEVQGQIWKKGGHSTGTGITRDCEKTILLQLEGYRVFPVTAEQIESGKAIAWIKAMVCWLEFEARQTRFNSVIQSSAINANKIPIGE